MIERGTALLVACRRIGGGGNGVNGRLSAEAVVGRRGRGGRGRPGNAVTRDSRAREGESYTDLSMMDCVVEGRRDRAGALGDSVIAVIAVIAEDREDGRLPRLSTT